MKTVMIVLLGSLLLAGCVKENSEQQGQKQETGKSQASEPPKPAAVIEMHDRQFVPAKLSVHAGETVEWKNTSSSTHEISSNSEKAAVGDHTSVPAGARMLDSGPLQAGNSYFYTFKVPGVYKYICTYHEHEGMIGEVDVQ